MKSFVACWTDMGMHCTTQLSAHLHGIISICLRSASIRYPFDETLGSVIFHDYHKHINLKTENNMHMALSSETQ